MQNRSMTVLSNYRAGESSCAHNWTDYLTTYIDNISDKPKLSGKNFFENKEKNKISCNIESGVLGCLKLERLREAPYKFKRDKKTTADYLSNPIILILQISGSASITGMSTPECLESGKMVVIDTRSSFEISSIESSDQLIVTIPRNSVAIANEITHTHSNRFECKNGLGKLLYDLLKQSIENYELLNESSKTSIAQSVLQLIPIIVAPSYPTTGIYCGNTGIMIQRIKQYIEMNLSDPYLAIENIAAENNCSVRTIHRLFKINDLGGVSHYIWNRRVVSAAEMLIDSGYSGSSITDIAFNCGFSCSAHFSRVFKSYYGVTPRKYRKSISMVN